jgi:hypothetical protein
VKKESREQYVYFARDLEGWQTETDFRQHLRIEDLPNEENPREWVRWRKMANVAVIALMSSKQTRLEHTLRPY